MTSFLENKILIYIIPFFLGLVTSYSLPPFSFVFINFITFPILFILLVSNYKTKCMFYITAKWSGPSTNIPNIIVQIFTEAFGKKGMEKIFKYSYQ